MATFTDDFNRANSDSLGADWTEYGNGTRIVSNGLGGQTTGDGGAACDKATGADNYAQGRLLSGHQYYMLWVRGDQADQQAGSFDGYLTEVEALTGGRASYLYKTVAGSTSVLGSTFTGPTSGSIIYLEADGSDVTAKSGGSGGTVLRTVTDTSVTAGTWTGLKASHANTTAPSWDDWECGDLGGGGDATATPAVVAATVSVPAAARNVAAGPAVAAAVVAVPAPTVLAGGNATATPGVIPGVVAAPAATASGAATTTPAAAAASLSVPRPGVSVAAGPTIIACTVTLPAATPQASSTVTSAVIPVTVTLPQATPEAAGNATAGPSTIAATVTLPQAQPSGAATAQTTTVAVVVDLGVPVVGSFTVVEPATVAAVAALHAAGVNVAAGPVTVPVTVSFPSASAGPPTEFRDITVSVTIAPSPWGAAAAPSPWSATLTT